MLKNITRILPFFITTLVCIGGVELLYGVAEHYLLRPADKAAIGKIAVEPSAKTEGAVEKHKNYDVIVTRNLFQSYNKEPGGETPEETESLEELKNTTLDLVLMGTVSGADDRGRAIIMEKAEKKQEIYYRGDVIQGAKIKEILRGKVILTYLGKDEILDMAEANKYKPKTSPAVAPVPTRKRVVSRPQASSTPRRVPALTRKPQSPRAVDPAELEELEEIEDLDDPDLDTDLAEDAAEQDDELAENIEEADPENGNNAAAQQRENTGQEQTDN